MEGNEDATGRGEERRKISSKRTRGIRAIRHFHSHLSSSLQTGIGACGHPIAPIGRPGVCTRTSHRGVSGSEGREGANGVGGGIRVGGGNKDGNGVGSGNRDVNVYTDRNRAGNVAANQDNLENSNTAGRDAQGTQGLSKNCRCKGCVSYLSRVIKYFPKKYHQSLFGRTSTSGI